MPYKDFNPDDRKRSDFEYPQPGLLDRLTARPRLALANYAEGLDLSHWRPDLDLKSAKEQGIRFVITKATEGDYFVDDWYIPYHDQSKSLDLAFTGFHYWKADTPAIDQAKYYLSHTQDDHELLDVLDCEKYFNEGVLSQDDAAQNIHDTAQEIQQKRGRKVMIYTNSDSWTVLTGNSPIIATYPLWVASWRKDAPVMPIGADEWVLWQYTNSYVIPGAPNAGYDGNRYNGNEAEFTAYLKSINGSPGAECCDELLLRIEAIEQKDMAQDADIYTNGSHLTDTNEAVQHLNSRVTELERIAEQQAVIDRRVIVLESKMSGVAEAAEGDE